MSSGFCAIAIGGVSLDLRCASALGTDARHVALVKSAWRNADQMRIIKDRRFATGQISGGCFTAIATPDGRIFPEPLSAGEGDAIAGIDSAIIHSRKRLMDAGGRYSRPELISLLIDRTLASHIYECTAHPNEEALQAAVDEEKTFPILNQPPLYRPTASSPKHSEKAQNPEGIYR